MIKDTPKGMPIEPPESEYSDVIQYMEQTYPEMTSEFKQIQKDQYELFCKKQYDYGSGNITLGGDLENESDRMLSLIALVIRMNDKVNRLKNIIIKNSGKNAVSDETYMDAFRDLSVYGVIAQLVAEKVWGK